MNIAFIGMACALGLSAMGSAFGSGFAAQASVGAWKKCYANGKPAPDGYLRACELLGADPTRCIAVEDSAAGISSAANAGMTVVAVLPHFRPPSADVLGRCAAVLDDLSDLTGDLVTTLPPAVGGAVSSADQ